MTERQDWDTFLRQDPPRVVPGAIAALALRDARRWQLGLVAGVFVCALVVAIVFPWSIIDEIRLDFGGEPGRGVVLASTMTKHTVGDNAGVPLRHVFEARFRFEGVGGRSFEATCLIFERLQPGTVVDVEYLPADPSVARISSGFFVPGGYWEVLWGSIFAVLPLIGIWNYRRWCKRQLMLLRHGVSVQGQLERVWRDQPDEDTRGWIEITYLTAVGRVRLSRSVEREIYERARAIADLRKPLRVLHDPQLPSEHVIVELLAD